MKHLKTYNESKSSEFIDECKYILLELDDIGFKTNMRYAGLRNSVPKWISFYFSKKAEAESHENTHYPSFDYSDIEDVVERLKSFLYPFGLRIQWQSPSEKNEQKPTIRNTVVMDPTNFQPENVMTVCELYFES
jgi:hypothetical protein